MVDNNTYPEWSTDPLNILYFSFNLGFTAQKFWDNATMGEVIIMMANFYLRNENATDADIAQFLGTSENNLDLLYEQNYNASFTRTQILGAASVLPQISIYLASPDPVTPTILPLLIVFTVLSGLVVGLRFYFRRKVAKILASDWLMLIGYLLTIVLSILSIMTALIGPKSNLSWEVSYRTFANGQIYLEIIDVLYPIPLFFVKASYLSFYFRLTAWRYFRWAVNAAFVFVLLQTIAASLCQLIWQFPVDWWYHLTDLANTTQPINIDYASLANGCISIFTDVVIWVLPLPLIWKLGVSAKERRVACVTFGFGIMASIIGIVRLPYAYDLSSADSVTTHAAVLLLLPPLEVYVAVIAGSLPIVRAMAVRSMSRRTGTGETSIEGVSKSSQPSAYSTKPGDMDELIEEHPEPNSNLA